MNKILIPFLLIVIFSCDKNTESPKDYSGTYDCENTSSWFSVVNDPSENVDSTSQLTLDVFQNGDMITIHGFAFHVDSIANENTYTEYDDNGSFTKIRFYSEDSIYYKYWTGGNGGDYSSTYIGRKM